MKFPNDRINQLLLLADKLLATNTNSPGIGSSVDSELFQEFRTASLSFIINIYDTNHPYYLDFHKEVQSNWTYMAEQGRGILKAIKSEIDGGWLITVKGLISAEIFSNFLEMAKYLIDESYKDPAAVIIGSVLEEHLRQLCIKNGISCDYLKSEKSIPKKSDQLNNELSTAAIYNKLDQKNVTAWLDLRNKAAHGKYSEYNLQQVELMYQSVIEFMTRNSI